LDFEKNLKTFKKTYRYENIHRSLDHSAFNYPITRSQYR